MAESLSQVARAVRILKSRVRALEDEVQALGGKYAVLDAISDAVEELEN